MLVPLNERETMATLMIALGVPVVVAARTTLGTINHTLLTLEALRLARAAGRGCGHGWRTRRREPCGD